MKQLQVTAPKKYRETVEEILDNYSSDVSSNEAEKNDEKVAEFKVTTESEEIDELTDDLKSIKDIKSGELSIRVLEQEGLIEKGQETRGYASQLSQEEIFAKAQQFSGFNRAEWGLIGVSSAIAAYGLVMDNVIAVIGAMMLAPILSPFVSGSLSLVIGDKSLMKESFRSGLESAAIAIAVSFLAVTFFPVNVTDTLRLVAEPGILTVLLSLLVGSAAALTFSTGLRDQIAGVAVAIALVPPLASVGIGLKMQDYLFALNALSVVVINVASIVLSGFATFTFLGLKPSTYYKKKEAEEMRYMIPAAAIIIILLAVPIGYSSYNSYSGFMVEQEVESSAKDYFGDDLLDVRFRDSYAQIMVIGDHDETEFRDRTPEGINMEIVELQRSD